MSEQLPVWDVPAPSEGFAARVAREAKREHERRRARRLVTGAASVGLLVLAALVLFSVRRYALFGADLPAIRTDAPSLEASWPVTPGWKPLRFDFPLDFAPEIAYRGTVRLHLGPDFHRPGAPGYWGNVNIWMIDSEGAPPDPQRLELDLRSYFTGLCGTHGHPTTHTQALAWESKSARLSSVPLSFEDRALGVEYAFRGDVEVLDCIENGGEMSLNVDAVVGSCGNGTSFIAYALSPRGLEDPIWEALRAERRAFDCRKR